MAEKRGFFEVVFLKLIKIYFHKVKLVQEFNDDDPDHLKWNEILRLNVGENCRLQLLI